VYICNERQDKVLPAKALTYPSTALKEDETKSYGGIRSRC
jgi:hypothetical protein